MKRSKNGIICIKPEKEDYEFVLQDVNGNDMQLTQWFKIAVKQMRKLSELKKYNRSTNDKTYKQPAP